MRTHEQEKARFTFLRTAEVAEQLDCDRSHVVKLIRAGKLTAVDIGAGDRPEYRVSPDALDRYLEAAQVDAA